MQIDVSGDYEVRLMLLESKLGMLSQSCPFVVVYTVQQS